MWHEVLKLAGEDREKLLNAKQEAPKNFQKVLANKAALPDAEIIDVSEIYIMYLAEYRKLNTFDQICKTLDKIDSFDSMDNHYVIACTAKDKPAEYYWTEIEKATMFANNLLIIIPESAKEKKPKFVEQMLEYHKKCDGLIVLAFCNDMNAIRKAHRYCHMVNFKPDYDSPKSGRNPGSAYMQGKRIILTGGNKKDADSFNYKSDEEKKEEEQQRNASVEQKANWIRNNRCRHCGGEFVGGFFSKTCVACGQKKDY